MMPTSTNPGYVIDAQRESELRQLEVIAEWLDRRYLDPILSFVLPGVGNVVGALVGLYGVGVGVRLSVHPIVLARMLLNLALDSLIGSVPLLGPIGDLFYRAHVKNLALVRERTTLARHKPSDWLMVGGALCFLIFAMALPVLLALSLAAWLLYAWQGH